MNYLRKPRLLVAIAAGLGTLLLTATVHGLPLGDDNTPASTNVAIRVDQVGYVRGEAKRAYVMGPSAALAGARFEVVDAKNKVVTAGQLGADIGRWNTKYPSVRTADLSALDTPGTYRIVLTGTAAGRSPAFRIAGARELMTPLVQDNVRFLQAQRDGADVLPGDLAHGPSHLADKDATVYADPNYNKEGTELLDKRLTPTGDRADVSGGWFDAGDFLKFTGTTSYSVAELLLAQRDLPDMKELSAEASHGLAWMDKMWDEDSKTLYAQVGIGAGNEAVRTDHDVWRLPEADDRLDVSPGDPDYTIKHRPVFRANNPGKPITPSLAGRVAAVFALAAQRAADTDPKAARTWLDKAAAVYDLADTNPNPDALFTAFPKAFYPEDSWQDDLEFAGAELALAARKLGDNRKGKWADDAARWAGAYLRSDVQGTLGVADVSALAHADLATVLDGTRRKGIGAAELNKDLRRQLEDGVARAKQDPFGAGAVYDDFDAVPHTFGLVATARLYAKATGDTRYAAFAGRQRGWALGANPWGTTFMIGAGEVYPHCPEHQLANLRGSLDGKGAILRGAVVNGPNAASKLDELNSFPTMKKCTAAPPTGAWTDFDGKGARYLDDVGAWQTVEPALDFTTTALLAFALTARSDADADANTDGE
ncbi:glycoside hydrolase family 9 protein [Streptomyces sp. NBC_00878]|uniref:glycoside hydrolase family 9 protein n=1 Tax=Streptomyces sp. NBC_00878 TaxID=2975854 RepID=UPI00224C93F3|nr:glycoside hydrolase family 9 protein [Streptomyces sp. NBC_00878]MCX4903736.1 glycoside hydrolase family 9 protein [Streptomyces sp. NBC_00878]